jgi:alkanesulfonate monooxygenase SsuD/methylene tetrahydromethanopterin reductase-like flavin-dependent oxidoreductase (luciferase family)
LHIPVNDVCEADRLGVAAGPDQLAIRRNISIARSADEAREAARTAMEMTLTVLAGDPRVGAHPSLLDAPKTDSGFSVHEDEFITGTPSQVAEQIIVQCRACRAGHVLAILGRTIDQRRVEAVTLFGEEVIPVLRRAQIR